MCGSTELHIACEKTYSITSFWEKISVLFGTPHKSSIHLSLCVCIKTSMFGKSYVSWYILHPYIRNCSLRSLHPVCACVPRASFILWYFLFCFSSSNCLIVCFWLDKISLYIFPDFVELLDSLMILQPIRFYKSFFHIFYIQTYWA